MLHLHALGMYVRRNAGPSPTLQVRAYAVGRSFTIRPSVFTPLNRWGTTTVADLHNGTASTLDTSGFVNWVARAGGVPIIGADAEPLQVHFHWFWDLGEAVVFPGPFAARVELSAQLIEPKPGRFFRLLVNDTITDPLTRGQVPYREIQDSAAFQAAADAWKRQNRDAPLIAGGIIKDGKSVIDELLTADVFLSTRIASPA